MTCQEQEERLEMAHGGILYLGGGKARKEERIRRRTRMKGIANTYVKLIGFLLSQRRV
jgi:hypothetical protein